MEINVPSKVLSLNVLTATALDSWSFDDGKGDEYWNGGSNSQPYRWQITVTVTPQTHGSHLTREKKLYNGLDIFVGDWIAGSTSGVAVKIISIEAKTETSATLTVEDVFRYNTFKSATGVGIFNVPGFAVCFMINEQGDPIVDPLPLGIVSADFYANLESRFKAFSLQDNFELPQIAHGFEEGDSISIDPVTGQFEKTSPDSLENVVGTAGELGPGPNAFLLRPTTRIVEDYTPALPGTAGDRIYVDPNNPGVLTTTKTPLASFLQLTDAIPTSVVGTNSAATTGNNSKMNINGVEVLFTGPLTVDIDEAVSDINVLSTSHHVVASKILDENNTETNTNDLTYGLVGAFTSSPGPARAIINGVEVIFNDDTDGLNDFALNVAINSDMARSINAANIPGIVASTNGSLLVLTELTGQAIVITNSANDTNGNGFAGPSSCSGLPLNTPITTDTFLKLDRADGGEIILQNVTNTPIDDYGLVSVHNGKLPIGLVIEQGIRRGDVYVVADIVARDSINGLVGDQAYTLDKGDGEWGQYLWDGSQWILTASAESARVDSDSVSMDLDFLAPIETVIAEVNGNNGRLGSGSRVSPVTVDIIVPFNGTPTLSVGDAGDNERLFTNELVDFTTVGTYESTPSYQYDGINDTQIIAYFARGGATQGEAKITITYS